MLSIMTNSTAEKIKTAIEIFETELPGAKDKYDAFVSTANTNEVDIFSEAGLYCTINVKSMKIKGI